MSTTTAPALTAQQCRICLRLKYFYPEEGFESSWMKELLPDAAAMIEKYESAVCEDPKCVKRNAEIVAKIGNTAPGEGVEQIGQVILIPHKHIRPFPGQPRKYFDPGELRDLAESIGEVGQVVPVFVKEIPEEGAKYLYELIDGQRRYHAVEMAGKKRMKAIILSVKDAEEQFLISIVSNFGRAEHSAMEIALAIERFEKNGKNIEQITKIFSMSQAWIYNHRRLLRLAPEVRDMMSLKVPEEKRLVYASALLLANFTPEKQKELAPKIRGDKIKQIQIKAIVRQEADKMGITIGDPDRTPNRDYNILWSFLFKIEREMEVTLKNSQLYFDRMFANRASADHGRALAKLDDCIAELKMLQGAVQKAKKG